MGNSSHRLLERCRSFVSSKLKDPAWNRHAELLSQAVLNIRAARLRSAMALLGIVIGAASIASTVNIAVISRDEAQKQFQTLSPNLVNLSFSSKSRLSTGPRYADLAVAIGGSASLEHATPIVQASGGSPTFEGHELAAATVGTTAVLAQLLGLEVTEGRFLSRFDLKEPYAVIGSSVGTEGDEFSRPPALADKVHIGNAVFTVIGRLAPRATNPLLDVDIDNSIFVPAEAVPRISSQPGPTIVAGRLGPRVTAQDVEDEWRNLLAQKNLPFEPVVREAREVIEVMAKQQRLFVVLFSAVGFISLLMGGGGIMNIMLMAVVERRSEIGLRIAVGARRRDIIRLFLAEAGILSVLGGLAGIALSLALTLAFSLASDTHFAVSGLGVLLSMAVTCAIGVGSGYYPAVKAADSDPIAALRTY